MPKKNALILIGDFFFKYRNLLFPAFMVLILLGNRPPSEVFGSEAIEALVDWLALLLVALGLGLRAAVIGYRYIKRGGLDKKVYAADLVTDGFFGVCRNPLYVGNLLIYSGVLIKHGNLWTLLIGTAFFLFVYTAIVAAEEFFLRNKFGDAYQNYCQDVPRWRMRIPRLKQATEGMKFNLQRALVKDYSTIANAVVTMVILELLEKTTTATPEQPFDAFPFAVMISGVILLALAVRVLKKRKILKPD